jgi:hypothetical protein
VNVGLRADLWTLYPYARHMLLPIRVAPGVSWSTELDDPQAGRIRLTGRLRELPGARTLVLIVHGLGGSPESYYCLRGARALESLGVASLCLSLRGSDRRGEDFYNIALVDDLHAALASPALAQYTAIHVLGYSMGGYVALHLAREPRDPRLKSVAAVCTPIELLAAQRHIDSRRAWFYRRHVLSGLISIYSAVAARGRPIPTDAASVRRVKTIYEWDRLTIAPRYGFASPEDYYERLSIRPHLADFQIPALLVASRSDPIVPPGTIEPYLPGGHHAPVRSGRGSLEVRFAPRGGHVHFDGDLDLGFGPKLGLEPQLLAWMQRQA